jgi:hypothetical protein
MPDQSSVCVTCGLIFARQPRGREPRFCSPHCKYLARYVQHAACAHCGMPFTGYADAKGCSRKCAAALKPPPPKPGRTLHDLTCKSCGKSFMGIPKKLVCCSLECRYQTRHFAPRLCKWCRQQFVPETPSAPYCSPQCRLAWHEGTWESRFWSRIQCDIQTRCWNWTGAINTNGYGVMWSGRAEARLAHVLSHERLVGPIPPRFQVDHLCANRRCVSPEHIEAVTQQVNLQRQHARLSEELVDQIMRLLLTTTSQQSLSG